MREDFAADSGEGGEGVSDRAYDGAVGEGRITGDVGICHARADEEVNRRPLSVDRKANRSLASEAQRTPRKITEKNKEPKTPGGVAAQSSRTARRGSGRLGRAAH